MAFKNALTILFALTALSLAPAASAQQVEGIAAVVNDEPITTLEVRDRMRLIITSAGVQPSEDMLPRIQDQAIRGLIDERLQLQTAREFDLQVEDSEVDASLEDIAARSGATVAEIEADLAANGIDIQTLRQQVEAEIAWQIMVSGRYRSRIRISDQQIETALDRIVQSASQPQYRLGEIFIEVTPERSEEQAIAIVQAIYSQLAEGAPFQALAEQFSDAASASSGGDTGYLPASGIRPQVLQVVQQLNVGGIANPIRVPGGLQIVALIDRREGQVVEELTLAQITLTTSRLTPESRAALEAASDRITGCENLDTIAAEVEGALVTNLGAVAANALVPQIREALATLEPGQATDVLSTAAGAQVFVLCDRALAGPGVPTTEQIENQLVSQQLSLLARRWLRDIRRDATIEIR